MDREKNKQREGAGMAAPSSLVALEDVTGSSTAELLAKVAGEGLQAKRAGPAVGQAGTKMGPSVVHLLERFDKCDKELARMLHQVELKAERLRREVGREEVTYRAQVAGLEAQWAAARHAFGDLESRMNRVTQTAAKIGNRLQNADLYRRRALDAMEAINRLQEFAHARDPSHLSPLFHDDARMAEAAAMTSKLLCVCQELVSSRERVGLAGPQPRPNEAPELGSIEAAVEQLELYRNLLDNRVVSRFDAALARQDLPAMAHCARIMAQFSRGEDILVQRYISTRPMFTNLRELQFAAQQQLQQQAAAAAAAASSGAGGVGVGGAANGGSGVAGEDGEEVAAADVSALRALTSFYKGILAALRDEAVVIEQVFPSPYRALARYVQRVFEQKVQTAVDAVMAPPTQGASHAVLRGRLRLVAEVVRKTRGLAADLQELCGGEEGGGSGGVSCARDLADSACADALAAYLPMELRWLAGRYQWRLAAHRSRGGGVSMEEVLDMMARNEEAVTRCVLLSPPGQVAASVRCLFHSSPLSRSGSPGCLGCLLDQVAAHLLLGLGQAMDACNRGLMGPFQPHNILAQHRNKEAAAAVGAAATVAGGGIGSGGGGGGGGGWSASTSVPASAPASSQQQQTGGAIAVVLLSVRDVQRAADVSVCGSVGVLLQAVSTVGAIVWLLQQHYHRVLAPHLAGPAASGESRACLAGLSAVVRGVEERVAGALQRCLSALMAQADATLVAQQQRTELCPPQEGPPPPLDTPTPACLAVCALLSAAVDAVEQHLHGPNLASLLAELGRRVVVMLGEHMQRFSFSPLGALRWRRDLQEYGGLLARCRSPAASQQLEDMQAGVNMLIVPPDSLLSLVDATLLIPHRAALDIIRLRQDFKTARVGHTGATLPALFNTE